MKKEKIIIFGIGQIAEVAYFYLKHDSPHEIVAFSVDKEWKDKNEFHGLPVISFEEVLNIFPPDKYKFFAPISYRDVNKLRAKKFHEIKKLGYSMISYVCSKATTWPGLNIGENCFIFENNVIQPYTTIGDNVILWSGNHIGHHTTIKSHCFITSHVVVSGSVEVGEYCFFGVNSTIRDNIVIADHTVLGSGAVITKNTVEHGVYYAAGANILKQKGTSKDLKKI